ncbi:MAG: winged helix-turn-helix transcriptional regulator [Candidatus Sumerlaeaceae bacterium]
MGGSDARDEALWAKTTRRTSFVGSAIEEVLGCKWSVQLLLLVASGIERPGQLRKACPGLSTKVMNERLRKLQAFELLSKTTRGEKPPLQVYYQLTPLGVRLASIIQQIKELDEWWAKERAKR